MDIADKTQSKCKNCAMKLVNSVRRKSITRICPSCNKVLSYKNRTSAAHSERKNSLCKKCHHTKLKNSQGGITFPEFVVGNYLTELDLDFQFEYTLYFDGGFRTYDFYIPSLNILLEVDGVYWHGKVKNEISKKVKENDIFKEHLAKRKGFNIVRIWEDELDDFTVLKNKLHV